MTKDEIKDYSLRIINSNKSELVVVTYDIMIDYIKSAKTEMETDNYTQFAYDMKKFQQYVNNLAGALDFKVKLSYDLLSIYLYLNRKAIEAICKKSTDSIDEMVMLITKLKTAFEEVSKQDNTKAVIRTSEKVYSGLTYGRNCEPIVTTA